MRKKRREWYKIERSIDLAIIKRRNRYQNSIRFYISLAYIDKLNKSRGRVSTFTSLKHSRRRFLQSKGYIQDEILISGMYKGN